jgi:hypothetical protein
MGTINLEDIQTGMILGKNVIDRSGRILLGSGQEITEKHLRIFKMWGVTEADIHNVKKEEVSAQANSLLDPVMLRDAQVLMLERFKHADMQHPFNSELFRLLCFRMVKQTQGDSL